MRGFVVAAILALAATAQAQPTAALGYIGADVRRAIAETATDGERAFTAPSQRNATTSAPSGRSIAPLLATMNCGTSTEAYWDTVGPWIRRNTSPAAGAESLANSDGDLSAPTPMARSGDPSFRNPAREIARDMRRRVQRVEATIQSNPQHLYLLPDDSVLRRPMDRAADLRQRAEWMTFLAAFLPKLREAHEAAPRDFENAFALALWTRAACAVFHANSEAALASMNELGYPAEAQYGQQTEVAFAMLVRASSDAPFAKEALHRGGGGVSEIARRILEPLATTAPATSPPQP